MVDLEVLAFQVCLALPPSVHPDEHGPDVVGRAFPDQEAIARDAAGLVNQGGGHRPVAIVERGVAQRRQDPRKRVLVAHGDSSFAVMSEPPVLDGAVHMLLGPALAGAGPHGDGLAQSFQQPFEFGLAMLHPAPRGPPVA